MTEKELQQQVVQLAKMLGFLVYHTYNSRRSAAGFPDLVLIHPRYGIRVAELKVGRNKPTAAQEKWLAALRAAGVPTYLWTDRTPLDEIRRALMEEREP